MLTYFTNSLYNRVWNYNLGRKFNMARQKIQSVTKSEATVDKLYEELGSRVNAVSTNSCPIDVALGFVRLCHSQSCGKCVPCRVGLGQLATMMESILDGEATMDTIDLIERTAQSIYLSADCAIGYEAANMVLVSVHGFREDFKEHVRNGRCMCNFDRPVPCVTRCPANVDIPGYIALAAAGRPEDAVRQIRKDNPFPTACALICEHPCERYCRRQMVDDAVNIRGIKRYVCDKAGNVPAPECAPSTGKRIAIVGGGPSGLTAAYYLQLMGHQTTVFEEKKHLGGMLRYGIPNYRLPRVRLQEDIDCILSTGVDVRRETKVDTAQEFAALRDEYDAVYLAIGAHMDKKVGLENEDAEGVISAVEMLRDIGDGIMPDYTGKKVIVIGGGNVAMDCTRTAIRAGAAKVSVAYRRRIADMTALEEEINGAEAEGAEILELNSPSKIQKDENGRVKGLLLTPQMISEVKRGRPAPVSVGAKSVFVPCDILIVAIGQAIGSEQFADYGIPRHWDRISSNGATFIAGMDGVFSGGDCATGPATVIKAIAAGKTAAANIDEYLGYNHIIKSGVDVPKARVYDRKPCGRVNMREREAGERNKDFEPFEYGMSDKEAMQEANRCLRCDHFGYGCFEGGRVFKW